MKTLTSNKAFWLLLVICVVTILPFLGLPEYHTKGEPRESIDILFYVGKRQLDFAEK